MAVLGQVTADASLTFRRRGVEGFFRRVVVAFPRQDWPRSSTVDTEDGGGVEIATVQNVDGDVLVWVDAEHGSMLTPGQARAAADELLEAAPWVEDQGTHLAVSQKT